MRNVAPQVDTDQQVSVAEEQEEYKTVVAIPVEFPTVSVAVDHPAYKEAAGRKNSLLLAYKPNRTELEKLMRGELLYLHMLTFGGKLQPHILTVGTDELGPWYGLRVVRPNAVPCGRRRIDARGGTEQCTADQGHDGDHGPWETLPPDYRHIL